MINNQEHNTYITSSNGTKLQFSQSKLSSFVASCETIGVDPDDFGIMIYTIWDHVIDGSDDLSPSYELKKPLLFLRAVRIFLNSLKIN